MCLCVRVGASVCVCVCVCLRACEEQRERMRTTNWADKIKMD